MTKEEIDAFKERNSITDNIVTYKTFMQLGYSESYAKIKNVAFRKFIGERPFYVISDLIRFYNNEK